MKNNDNMNKIILGIKKFKTFFAKKYYNKYFLQVTYIFYPLMLSRTLDEII